jgi:signal transduction histidine kinase
VAQETANVLDVPLTSVVSFDPDGSATQVGAWGPENPFPVGTRWMLDERSVSGSVWRSGRPARVDDYSHVSGEIARGLGDVGIQSAVGAPIVVDRGVWGVLMALSSADTPLPEGTEVRLAGFTELVATAISNTQARDDLSRLAQEQAALRRVATLVAGGADPQQVFDAVCEETGVLIGSTSANLARFTRDGFNLTLAGWSLRDTHVPAGTRLPIEGDTVNAFIRSTGAPSRFEGYTEGSGNLATVIRRRGIRSEVGAPVTVEGEVWGALIVGTDRAEPLPPGTEARVAGFAELVATALSNAAARTEIVASRARIVAAADDARRRIERDLHDGVQQRLVTLILELRALQSALGEDREELRAELGRLQAELATTLDDVREISRGLHPAILSHAGLEPAIKSLAARSSVPVELDLRVDGRLPSTIEVAAYYVVSEALTNAAKHAQASLVEVGMVTEDGLLRATIRDNGTGVPDPSKGTGLTGLRDRVEALGGRFAIASPLDGGTSLAVELPLDRQPGLG